VTFRGEDGIDAGGLLTELYAVATASMCADSTLFEQHDRGTVALPVSSAPEQSMEAIGRLLARCMVDRRSASPLLPAALFKALATPPAPADMADLEDFDPALARTLRWLLVSSSQDIELLGLDFGDVGGDEVAVHEGNRQEYVQQRVRYAVHGSRQKQLDALKKGYEDVLRITCPQVFPLLQLLSHVDLRLLLCGELVISPAQVLAVSNIRNASAEMAGMLTDAIQAMDSDTLRRLLFFTTGSPTLPVHKTITIRVLGSGLALPTASTCSLELRVPAYSSSKLLWEKLNEALGNAGAGFMRG